MALRFAVVIVIALIVFQSLSWESDAVALRGKREEERNVSQVLSDAFQELGVSLNSLVEKVKNDKTWENITNSLKTFSEDLVKNTKN